MEPMQQWLGDLMDGMAGSPQKEACLELLRHCGGSCARRHALPHMDGLRADLAGAEGLEDMARIIARHTGAESQATEDGFILTYNRGRGCDCALVRGGYVTSPLFCNCTLGFHETVWSTLLARPVAVELQETFLCGGNCCAQRITLK